MPNIPNVPGVPALLSFAENVFTLLTSDLISALGFGDGTQWGIFLDGAPVIDFDSFVDFNYRRDFAVATYPIEDGGFQSYDKVENPAEIRIRLNAGGDDLNRQNFLNSIDEVLSTIELYNVVTPEKTFIGYNFTHQDFRRQFNRGLGLISVDLHLQQIRPAGSLNFQDTQSPPAQGTQNIGNVQPQPVPDSVQQNFGIGTWKLQ